MKITDKKKNSWKQSTSKFVMATNQSLYLHVVMVTYQFYDIVVPCQHLGQVHGSQGTDVVLRHVQVDHPGVHLQKRHATNQNINSFTGH